MSAVAIIIRPAAAADLDAVRALLRETWHQVYDPIIGRDSVNEVTSRWHAAALLARQLDQPRSSFLVAHDGALLAAHGFAQMREPATLVVSRLYVRPSHQRQGIGRRLLEALRARHADAATLRLFVAAENARGVAFYRGAGFAVVEEGVEEGARVLHMEKHLGGAAEHRD
jgi:ribosomal protein S18 acetylase RimI-like enzyme